MGMIPALPGQARPLIREYIYTARERWLQNLVPNDFY
jgi:hypothetical protein